MDGKGRWVDNVMIERLWRTVKYECMYLQEFNCIKHLRSTIKDWVGFFQSRTPALNFLVDLHPMTCIIKGNKISRLI